MKFRLKTVTFIILADILVDFVLSIVFSVWADRETWTDYNNATNRTGEEQAHTKGGIFSWPPFLHNYNFFVSQLDFIFFSLLRLSVLCGAFTGILKNRTDGPSKLACSSKGAFLGFLSIAIFSLIKLLALAEIRSTFYDVPFFWLNFAGNFLFSASAFCCWYLVLTNVLPPPPPKSRDQNVDGSTNDLAGNSTAVVGNGDVEAHENHSDTARLIDHNGIAEPELTPPNQPDDKKEGSTEKEGADDKENKKKKEKVSLKEARPLLLRLASYSLKDWPWYLLGFVFLLLYSAGRMLIPLFTSDALKVISDRSYDQLTGGILKLLGLCVASAIFSGLRGGAFTYASSLMILRIRSTLFLSLVRQEIGFFDTTKTGEITSRLTSDCQTLTDTFTLNVNCFLRNLIMFIGSFIIMLSLSWQLTVIMLIMIPLATFVTHIFGSIFQKLSTDMQDTLAKANEVADEVLGSMRTVRSFANERKESERYDLLLGNTLKILVKRCLFYVMYNGFGELFGPLALVVMLWYGGHLVLTDRMGSNVLLAFVLYQTLLGETIYVMGLAYNGLMEAGGASKKVFELIDRIPKIPNDGELAPKSVDGRVEFKNVNFSYPSRPTIQVLEDVNFSVEPGEIVALVGPSGGGKSSCIALLEHFYEPSSGEILLDGIQINRFNHASYHRKVALVGQEPVLYAKSVAENIAYALNEDEFTQDDIVRVSKLANAHQFIVSLNKGYDTYVGEKGAQLSGGQKQRVAIARAIIRKPKILLLDEATSALDAESEHLVQQALYENLAGFTIILIAHRLSTVQRANRIIVIAQGRVVQQGKHEELLKVDGLYKNLVQKQLLGDTKQEAYSKDNG